MDSKKIQALLNAIEKGSLTAAAQDLGYTQSGLTHMMNSLEVELGLNLLVRSKSGVRLSPAAEEPLPRMHRFLAAATELEHEAERLRQRNFSSLRLGAYSSMARHWVPELLANFREVCPDTQVSLTVDSMASIFSAVKNDELDCALTSYQDGLMQGLCWVSLWEDELLAVLPADYPLEGASLPAASFDGAEFLMPSMGFDLDILPIFFSEGRRISPIIHNSNMDDASIVSMVEHGLGVSVLSRLVMQDMQQNVLPVPLSPPAYRSLGIIYSERQSGDKNIRRLIACAQELIARRYPKEG